MDSNKLSETLIDKNEIKPNADETAKAAENKQADVPQKNKSHKKGRKAKKKAKAAREKKTSELSQETQTELAARTVQDSQETQEEPTVNVSEVPQETKQDPAENTKEVSEEKQNIPTKMPVYVKVIIAAAVIVLFYVLLWKTVVNSCAYKYLEAELYKFNKDYALAATIYDELGDYRLSQEKSQKLHHILGEECLNAGDYTGAMEEFRLSGENDENYYSYALGMYCFVNGSYEMAMEQLEGVNLLDSKETAKESRYFLAIDCIKACEKERALDLLEGMELDYAPGDFAVGKLKRFIDGYGKYMDLNGIWSIDSGLVGAYEAATEGCSGWEYDISAAEDTKMEFEVMVDDALNVSAVLNVTYPYYAAYSRDGLVQSMFSSYKTVTKRIAKDELSDQVIFDDNTHIMFTEEGGVFSFHDEGPQQLPEENDEGQVYSVRETTIVFNIPNISQH